MEDQETSLREDLESAIADTDDSAEETETTNEVEETAAPQAEEEAQEEVSGEGSPTEPAEPAAQAAEPAPQAVQPPVDWAPEVKAKWQELPPDVQSAVAAREAHINETLRETADIRQDYDDFNAMLAPYEPLMQAEGASDPFQAIQGLMNTTATLAMGSAQQKAGKIAAMINHYGVDIETLDQILAGQAPAEQAAPPSDPRIDQIWNRMQAAEQGQFQQQQQEAQTSIQAFAADPKNVHFQSVKNSMEDFIEIADKNGNDMTLDEAYQRACLADPQIAPLVTAEFANQTAQSHQQSVAGARQAAGSIAGKPASSAMTGITEDMSLRDTIKAQLAGSDRI